MGRANAPTSELVPAIAAAFSLVIQSSFEAVSALPAYKARLGSRSVPATPNAPSVGPTPRISSGFEVEPPTTKPTIRLLLPVPAVARTERLTSREVEGAPPPEGAPPDPPPLSLPEPPPA